MSGGIGRFIWFISLVWFVWLVWCVGARERRDGRETARLATAHFDLVGRNRLSGHTGIQDRWIQVGSVRPIDRP